jgi:hypothetical protein
MHYRSVYEVSRAIVNHGLYTTAMSDTSGLSRFLFRYVLKAVCSQARISLQGEVAHKLRLLKVPPP